MAIKIEYLRSLREDFFSNCKYSTWFDLDERNETVYLLDLSLTRTIEDLFIKVREVLPLDPNLSKEEVKDENWDALNDCIGGGTYSLLEKSEKFIICVKGIEVFSKKSLKIWLFLDILKEAFKNFEKKGRCDLVYIE